MFYLVFLNVSESLPVKLGFIFHDLWNIPGVVCLSSIVIYFFSLLLSLPWPSEPLSQLELPLELLCGCLGKLLNWIQDNNALEHKDCLVYYWCLSNWKHLYNLVPILQVWFFWLVLETKTLDKDEKNYIERKSLTDNLMFISLLKLKLLWHRQSWTSSLGRFLKEHWKVGGNLHVVQVLKMTSLNNDRDLSGIRLCGDIGFLLPL